MDFYTCYFYAHQKLWLRVELIVFLPEEIDFFNWELKPIK